MKNKLEVQKMGSSSERANLRGKLSVVSSQKQPLLNLKEIILNSLYAALF